MHPPAHLYEVLHPKNQIIAHRSFIVLRELHYLVTVHHPVQDQYTVQGAVMPFNSGLNPGETSPASRRPTTRTQANTQVRGTNSSATSPISEPITGMDQQYTGRPHKFFRRERGVSNYIIERLKVSPNRRHILGGSYTPSRSNIVVFYLRISRGRVQAKRH